MKIEELVTNFEKSKELAKAEEKWQPIPGYEGYEASNLGKIRSNPIRHRSPLNNSGILALKITWNRRFEVSLRKNKKRISCLVHRLVAMTFLPNPEHKPCINHKDGNPLNNHIENLEWVTYKENDLHARKNFLYGGEKTNTAKLTRVAARNIKQNKGIKSAIELATQYGVKPGAIYKIWGGQTWKYA